MSLWARLSLAYVLLLLGLTGCSSWRASSAEVEQFLQEKRGLAGGGWDELWILDRSPRAPHPGARSEGGLRSTGARPLQLDLTSVEVGAEVLGRLASVRVRQVFTNPGAGVLDLDYELPLPQDAAVTDVLVRFGDRRIRAVVRESEQAERLYLAARRQGLLASLVTRSDGVFRQRLGSVGPAEAIEVEVEYAHAVPWSDGWCELDLPAVPRRAVNVQVSIEVEAGVPIEEFDDRGGTFSVRWKTPDRAVLSLTSATGLAEPCSVRWRITATVPQGALFLCRDDAGEDPYFLLTVYGSAPIIDWRGLAPYHVIPGPHPPDSASTGMAQVGRLRGAPETAPRFGSAGSPPLVVRRAERLGRTLPNAWARLQIESLARQSLRADSEETLLELLEEMRATALAHGMVSYLTSLVMVDARAR